MTPAEEQLMKLTLDEALSEGKPWVAFDDQPEKELQVFDLHFFASASEAEQFCDRANGEWGFVEQMFNFKNFHYSSVAGLRADMGLRLNEKVDMEVIALELAAQDLHLLPGKHIDDLESAFAAGHYQQVCYQRQIDPLMAIADYTVIGHQHRGGQVYEIGHIVYIMQTFRSYGEAHSFLDSAMLHNVLSDRDMDYVLVGRFHNRQLEVDMEGHALPHAGLTLLTAVHNLEHRHDYHEVQSLFRPATVTQYFFAGLRDGKLALFNDKLEPTSTGQPQQPFYPAHYKHDYLTKQNLKSMNQSSYEYNKTQLQNLGFGTEIAEPLQTKMDQNLAEFTLDHVRKFGKDELHSVLHFSKGDDMQKDLTFFNRFDATLKQEGKEDLTQTFFIGPKYNYTLQERYNMMDGRMAYREQPVMVPSDSETGKKMVPTGETYWAWRGLDFKNADPHGNFLPKVVRWSDHAKELDKYPILGIEENYVKSRLIAQLQKGNKPEVTLLKDGQEVKAKMTLNAPMLRLDFHDENGQKLEVKKIFRQSFEQSQQTNLSPQEVQRAAIAKAAAEKEQTQGQQQGQAPQPEEASSQQLMQKVGAEQTQEQAQRQEQGQRRKHNVHV